MATNSYSFKTVSQQEYQTIIDKCVNISFYHSKERMDFLVSRKRKLQFFVIEKENLTVGTGVYQKIPARSGTFIYFQHSPVLIDIKVANDKQFWKDLYDFALDIGRKEAVVYVRMTPRIPESLDITDMLTAAGFVKAPVQEVDASVTRVIDIDTHSDRKLAKDIQEQLEISKKHYLSVDIKTNGVALQSFMMLYKKVISKSDTINLPLDYMKEELETYLKSHKLVVALVHDTLGTIYSGSVTILGKNTAWYYWTITTEKGIEFGSHALMIHSLIEYLKGQKIKTFDLWGEAVTQEIYDKKLSHPWLKSDMFKKGFGSRLIEYVLPIDIPVNRAIYRASCLYQRFNMNRRGYPFLAFEHTDKKFKKV